MKYRTSLIICSLGSLMLIYSCSKKSDTQSTPEPVNSGKTTIRIHLGNITVNESPLANGRKLSNYIAARTLESRTIYAVDVRTADAQPYAAGLFDNPDSILIEVPTGAVYSIKAAAMKRGSGLGLWYELSNNGLMSFGRPLNRVLDNKMTNNTDAAFLGGFSFTDMFNQDTIGQFRPYFPEMDTYLGSISLNADSVHESTIPMKRIVFGIKYNVTNFTEGTLVVDYSNAMLDKYLTPQNIDSRLSIYTADDFQSVETLTGWERILFTLKWIKSDGTLITLGSKELIPPQRNYITTVNITLPDSNNTTSNGIGIQITDTAWTSNNIINF